MLGDTLVLLLLHPDTHPCPQIQIKIQIPERYTDTKSIQIQFSGDTLVLLHPDTHPWVSSCCCCPFEEMSSATPVTPFYSTHQSHTLFYSSQVLPARHDCLLSSFGATPFFYSSPRCYPPGTIVPFFLRKLEDTSAAWTTLNFSCLSTIQDNTDKPPFSLETSCRIYNVYTFFP